MKLSTTQLTALFTLGVFTPNFIALLYRFIPSLHQFIWGVLSIPIWLAFLAMAITGIIAMATGNKQPQQVVWVSIASILGIVSLGVLLSLR